MPETLTPLPAVKPTGLIATGPVDFRKASAETRSVKTRYLGFPGIPCFVEKFSAEGLVAF